jgi:hypothetical protein
LTQTEAVFASIHETALNDLLKAFFTDRPRYLVYGSPSFVPATTVAETNMPAIAFPGIPGGIQWRLRLGIPTPSLFDRWWGIPEPLLSTPRTTLHRRNLGLEVRTLLSHRRQPARRG